MKILAIETSCDETAVAIVEDGVNVLSSVVATQIAEHRLYGGVVPEIASRRHCESIVGVTDEALLQANMTLDDVDAIAVTYAPGLIGALLVGVNFAKGLSLAANKPLIPVHHIRSHIAANYIAHPQLKPPFLCLVVSGGHSHIIEVKDYTDFHVIGRTRDDAAGEAFDKAARAMGYPYPGGIEIDKAAQQGNKDAYKLPRPKVDGCEYDFSFSGLKTAVLNLLHNSEQKGIEVNKVDLCASFQHAVCDIVAEKTMHAAETTGYKNIVVAGGVSANSGIRARLTEECKKRGYQLFIPPLKYCGDNAAMVGSQAYYEFLKGNVAGLDLNAVASLPIDEV
ncbi:tRNA (adenosine(37)-N6)-threonylcarbamoyltransferase complex transferase subunit TsaD [Paludicola sp. MB14-C6]|uniref:tRNA (adenosine(37)-N6)-threonylcarbamoyltransferase complex transferase subunit TsaD n=1 Tax=Paludihabitans sp. MB14-C6 TaxID=3070656 RepID=UPI0027DD61EB|nr:tRNA (adenosine(37)-N6)-threonylcarbamoyltransferase complex transferase subunit TsaD [Paludicola sp. MB14-C6]WMJ22367.1 tRNA (adenosine(37)-N6)-threonylcarbamoyltransferase complex transferase subunit TsaD [Paludicola sp. MB14-C6]